MDEMAEKVYRDLFKKLCTGLAVHGLELTEILQHEAHNLESTVAYEAGAQLYELAMYMESSL